MSRPEFVAPPDVFYKDVEVDKYVRNNRMQQIQAEMAGRALELLNLPEGAANLHILDLGCGCGFSGRAIEEAGHAWTGLDISHDMLRVARDGGESVVECDMGQYLPFRPGTFDGCISISAIQWLCQAYQKGQNPIQRLRMLFESLFAVVKRSSRCVFQFYPETQEQIDMITNAALKAGFDGGLVVDFPNSTKAKKFFIVLFAGKQPVPVAQPAGEDRDVARFSTKRVAAEKKPKKPKVKTRDWVLQKKQKQREKGMAVRPDSKYTGRKRRH